MSFLVCRLRTTAAYFSDGRTIALYAAHLAIQLHPYIEKFKRFKDLVAFFTACQQCLTNSVYDQQADQDILQSCYKIEIDHL